MLFSVKDISKIINARVIGDPGIDIDNVNSFDQAGPSDLTFAQDPKFLKRLSTCKAGAIIVPEDIETSQIDIIPSALLFCKEPKLSFFKIVSVFHPEKKSSPGINANVHIGKEFQSGQNVSIFPNVFIGDNVKIGNHVNLFPGVYIGDDAMIGNNVTIQPNVTIMEKTIIGNQVTIHSGTVIGSDGYGFVQHKGEHEKVIHAGHVIIEDDVEIGACTSIDRGTLGTTLIRRGVKIDNQVHIAHNVDIGEHSLIVGQVGIAGSATIGKNVIIAGKSGVSGHIKVGDNTIIGPFSGVHSNVESNQIVSGIPHMPHSIWRKAVTIISRLPELRKKLFSIEKRLNKLEKNK